MLHLCFLDSLLYSGMEVEEGMYRREINPIRDYDNENIGMTNVTKHTRTLQQCKPYGPYNDNHPCITVGAQYPIYVGSSKNDFTPSEHPSLHPRPKPRE